MTREYPPEVYGGAGVHVEYLARELRAFEDVTVHAWGTGDVPHTAWDALSGDAPELAALRSVSIDLTMAAGAQDADLVHTHTWYANFGGHLAKLVWGIPHVATVHSLEPLRPWKEEQLGGGYRLSSYCEQTALENADAVIAVSNGTKRDILRVYPNIDPERVHVIYNGIDTDEYKPDPNTDVLEQLRHRPGQAVRRVRRADHAPEGRRATCSRRLRQFAPDAQLVLCAGSRRHARAGRRDRGRVEELKATREGVFWIEQMLPKPDVIQLLSHATVFACPSIYEPLGIVNLEAMACEAAVVATATGGIVEVVVDDETGFLVPIEPGDDGTGAPRDPAKFAADFAERVNTLIADPERAKAMGGAGRERAVASFAWPAIAEQTSQLYRSLTPAGAGS